MYIADKQLRWHVFALAGCLLVLGLAHEWVNPWLRYDRDAIEAGQVWRLVTCHLVHLNLWHMAMNLAGLLLCWFFFTDLMTRRFLWTWLGVSAPAVGLLLFSLDPELGRYVGLSGLLHGLLLMLLIAGWRGNPVLHSVILFVIGGRMVWEQLPGYDTAYLQDLIQGRVYVNAHLYGGLTGLALSPFFVPRRRRTLRAPEENDGHSGQ
jgi:rhomboid family GlyGly-CTERM serine protease